LWAWDGGELAAVGDAGAGLALSFLKSLSFVNSLSIKIKN
jgi:hypothetical protein